jgi:hypothetical protein
MNKTHPTSPALPIDWAMTQMNRANVYQYRIEGDRRENPEAAIRGYDLALLELTTPMLKLKKELNRSPILS